MLTLPIQAVQAATGKLARIMKNEPTMINGIVVVIPSRIAMRGLKRLSVVATGIRYFSMMPETPTFFRISHVMIPPLAWLLPRRALT